MKFTRTFIFFLFVVNVVFAQNPASSWHEARMNSKGKVQIYYYDSDHFINKVNGKMEGIEYDLFVEFFNFLKDSLNIKIEYEFIKANSFGELYETVKNGNSGIFGACSFSITEKRLKEVQFSPKYMPDIEVLISSQNFPVVTDTNEFIRIFSKGKALSVPNTTFEQNFAGLKKFIPHIQIENTTNSTLIRERVSNEPNLFSYIELPSYVVSISQGMRLKRQLLFKVERMGYAFIYPKPSDWTEIIELFFNSSDFKMKMNKIIQKHLGEGVNDLLWNVASEKGVFKDKEIILLTKEREIQNLEIDKKELSLTRQKYVRNTLMGGVLVVLLILFLIYNRYRLKQKANLLLSKQKEEIEQKSYELEKANFQIKKNAEELERLSIVARETSNVVLILDANGKLEWINHAFEKLNGITKDELIKLKGETIFEISNNPNIRNIVDKAVRERRMVSYEALNRNIEGRKVWESSNLTPIFKEDGSLHKLVIIDIDITERKLAEEIIQQKNKDITDSINYAQKIQQALLQQQENFAKYFSDYFIIFKPKDIVSGDFYWATEKNDSLYICAADCTGHGVPGAFMSMLGIAFLNEITKTTENIIPSELLNQLREKVIGSLGQSGKIGESKDGMDIALCKINLKTNILQFAGANNSLWILRGKEITELKADRQPVGFYPKPKPFSHYEISLLKGDAVFLFTDGFADQFGGPDKRKFGYSRMKELIIANTDKNLSEIKTALDTSFENWKSTTEQLDDVCMMGIRI